MIITIDGPAASGKSTVARLVADSCGYYYLNSGLLYRALAYLLLAFKRYDAVLLQYPHKQDVDEYLDAKRLRYHYDAATGAHIFFDDQELTSALKSSAVDQGASMVSGNVYVRERLLLVQRELVRNHNVVAEGRDMGSIVFPNADVKFFLTATLMIRAQRWQQDQKRRGKTLSLQEAMQELRERDERDSNRMIAPLLIPQGAQVIDTSSLDKDAVVNKILNVIKCSTQ